MMIQLTNIMIYQSIVVIALFATIGAFCVWLHYRISKLEDKIR